MGTARATPRLKAPSPALREQVGVRGAPNKILIRLPRDPRPLRTVVARSSHRQPGQSERLSPLGRRRPARRCRRDREFRPSRPFLLQGRPAGRRCLAHSLQQRLKRLQSGFTNHGSFELFAKPENFNEMPISAGSALHSAGVVAGLVKEIRRFFDGASSP